MRVALYARVSTVDQDNGIQIAELTRYVESRGWTLAEIHQDHMSGAERNRPGLLALLKSARERRIDVVVVWKVDRFGRSTLDLLDNVRELQSAGVRFIAVSQGLDTDESNPISRFLLTVLGAVAELEREFIAERVRAGIDRAKKKGVQFGRPLKIFHRGKVQELRDQGMTVRQIASELGVGNATVQRLLKAVPKPPVAGDEKEEPPMGRVG